MVRCHVTMIKPLQAVTLPVLVDAENPHMAAGEVTCFPGPTRTRYVKVRAITAAEIKKRLGLEIFSSRRDSSTNEKFLYLGAGRLRPAYDKRDERGLQDALEMVRPWIPTFGTITRNTGGGDRREGARWDYSKLMSNAVQSARLVAWCPYKAERLLSPAVYCPNLETAAFVMMFMGDIRVCPKCHAPFIPKSGNVDYCKPAHGVAHRTARSRSRRKASQRAGEERMARKG